MTTVFSRTLNVNNVAGTTVFTSLERFEASIIDDVGGPFASVRVSLTPASASGNLTLSSVWIGHAALSGDAYDFAGDQVQLKFGGSTSVTLTTGGADVVSDPILFALDPTRALIIAYDGPAGSARDVKTLTGVTGAALWYKNSGGGDAATTNKSAYSTVASRLDIISKIEAFAPINLAAAFTDQAAMSATPGLPPAEIDLAAAFIDDSAMAATPRLGWNPPQFVNIGTKANQGFGTSVTPPLPASLVNGNLLIAVFYAGSSRVPTWPAGWTPIFTDAASGGITLSVACRVIDGSEAAPAITWSGSAAAHAFVMQFSGTLHDATAIGHFNSAHSPGSSTPMTNPGQATTSPDALVLAVIVNNVYTFTAGQAPAGYTSIFCTGNDEVASVEVHVAYDTAPAISQSVDSGYWITSLIELRSQPVVPIAVNLAAAFADAAAMAATPTIPTPIVLTAAFLDEALLANILTGPAPDAIDLSADITDAALMAAVVDITRIPSPPVQSFLSIGAR